MVLASTGVPFSAEAVRAAAAAADGRPVAVVTIARLHGFAFGLPNPGLLPTAREKEEQARVISDAKTALHSRGVTADGQIVITRNPAKAIAGIARRRGASQVALQAPRVSKARAVIEGDPARSLRRRLRGRCEVQAWYG